MHEILECMRSRKEKGWGEEWVGRVRKLTQFVVVENIDHLVVY